MKKIVLDTNIVSTFLKIGEIRLLQLLFPGHELTVPPAVRNELRAAGYDPTVFVTEPLTTNEKDMLKSFSRRNGSLGKGEMECIILCKSRNHVMLTNDRKAKRSSIDHGVKCYDLPEILLSMRSKGIVDVEGLRRLVKTIEARDNIIFIHAERLFE